MPISLYVRSLALLAWSLVEGSHPSLVEGPHPSSYRQCRSMDMYRLVWPFMLWGMLVMIVYGTTYASMDNINKGVIAVKLGQRSLGQASRVAYYVGEVVLGQVRALEGFPRGLSCANSGCVCACTRCMHELLHPACVSSVLFSACTISCLNLGLCLIRFCSYPAEHQHASCVAGSIGKRGAAARFCVLGAPLWRAHHA